MCVTSGLALGCDCRVDDGGDPGTGNTTASLNGSADSIGTGGTRNNHHATNTAPGTPRATTAMRRPPNHCHHRATESRQPRSPSIGSDVCAGVQINDMDLTERARRHIGRTRRTDQRHAGVRATAPMVGD
jgi:hypothetical protein